MTAAGAGTPKVSVVVPVWNPGRYFDRCVDSLLAQTMPPGELEVLFMDDGSDDGTERRLDELAAEHPHLQVHHLPGSGWPGLPRNLGTARATGDYVFYLDNDDELGPEALERMHGLGAANGADIVIGKVVSDWRAVPHQLWRTTRARCDLHSAPLFESLTPHKMFRREFLLEHDLRYPEGKRRLEDQLLLAKAYFPARSVSIVGDYTCYYYRRRDDGGNAGTAPIEPRGYYGNLREVLDVVAAHTEPGPLRDGIARRFYRSEMLGRLGGPVLQTYEPEFFSELVAEVRRLALEPRFSPAVHAGLPPALRVRSHLVRSGDEAGLLALAQRYTKVTLAARLLDLRWRDGALVARLSAGLVQDGEPVLLERDGGRLLLPVALAGDVPGAERDVGEHLDGALADVVVTERDGPVEWFLPARLERREADTAADGVQVTWEGEAVLDPATASGGAPLPEGVWDVSVRLAALGLTRNVRLGRDRDPAADTELGLLLLPPLGRVAERYFTRPYGNLSLDVRPAGTPSRTPPATVGPWTLTRRGGRTVLRATPRLASSGTTDLAARLLLERVEPPAKRPGKGPVERPPVVREVPGALTGLPDGAQLVVPLPTRSRVRTRGLSLGVWRLTLEVDDLTLTPPPECAELRVPARRPLQLLSRAEAEALPLPSPAARLARRRVDRLRRRLRAARGTSGGGTSGR